MPTYGRTSAEDSRKDLKDEDTKKGKTMVENRHASWDLSQMQALPLESKIMMTKRRIEEWYEHWDGDVWVSYSGGKDSTVLLHIARSLYPDIRAVFFDTGLEFPSVRSFVKAQGVEMVKPAMPFYQVVREYGYPVFSKEIAQRINEGRNYLEKHLNELKADIGKNAPTIQELSYEAAKWSTAHAKLNGCFAAGFNTRTGIENPRVPTQSGYNIKKYTFALEAPFLISPYCCNVLKKMPSHKYTKLRGGVSDISNNGRRIYAA